jgi:hypothetical protein
MFTTLLQCELITKGDKPVVRTARGRLSYPTVFEPKAMENDEAGKPKLRYSTTLLFPANVDLTALKDACYAVAAKKWGDKWREKFPKLPMPWHDSTSENQDGVPHCQKIGIDPKAFPVFIRTGSNAEFGRPNVITAKAQHVGSDQAEQVYAGRWARLTVQPYAYERASKKGVSLGLQNVQLLEDDEPLASMRRAATAEFEPVEIAESADSFFQ